MKQQESRFPVSVMLNLPENGFLCDIGSRGGRFGDGLVLNCIHSG